MPRDGRDSTCREINLRSCSDGVRASSSYLATTSATRHETSVVIRHNQNALAEDARMNRSG